MISQKQIVKIETYLKNKARRIDLDLYEFHFRNGSTRDVIEQLKVYQNEDGGFGNAIEPDIRLPDSTAIGTLTAMSIMAEIKIPATNEMLQKGLKHLVNTYDEKRNGWEIVTSKVDDYAHAPWWSYESAINGFGWGNPSAEILAIFIKYGDTKHSDLIERLKEKALSRINQVEEMDFHEILNFKALYVASQDEFKDIVKVHLEKLIMNSVNTDSNKWGPYAPTPLTFISSPNDSFAYLFDKEILKENLSFIVKNLVDDDHWEPNWDWAGMYPDEWSTAKEEWSGNLTVKNLRILQNFKGA